MSKLKIYRFFILEIKRHQEKNYIVSLFRTYFSSFGQRGNSDVPATEASAEDQAGLRLAENCADDGPVQHESGQDEASLDVMAEQGNVIGVTCKAFAYSKRAKDPCCAAVEDLQVLGTCAHGHRLSARWSIKQSQTSNLQGGGGPNGQQPGEGMVVRWWLKAPTRCSSLL